jgi:hypothetical protein
MDNKNISLLHSPCINLEVEADEQARTPSTRQIRLQLHSSAPAPRLSAPKESHQATD